MSNSELSFACTHVIEGYRPIRYVWKEDGETSYSCGEADHRTDCIHDWGMAHTHHFLDADPALAVLGELVEGDQVVRQRVGGPWLRLRV